MNHLRWLSNVFTNFSEEDKRIWVCDKTAGETRASVQEYVLKRVERLILGGGGGGGVLTSRGMAKSAKYTNAAPSVNPIATGTNANEPYFPESSAMSIAGASSDQ